MLRSLLFTPADDPRKIAKALASGADAVILDLEDSVAHARKAAARATAIETLAAQTGQPGPRLILRVNPLDSHHIAADLAVIVAQAPYAEIGRAHV